MTSAQIRQSFLDFFKSKQHTIVPSSSLMPDSPNLLFTNAGMNQFVPIFLGQRKPDVSKWPGAIAGSDTRAADTQKVIRAGGKHNDLDDVGLDTYHHTFFEMLGNWSFGDYFKKESLEWGWELLTKVWGFPTQRLYATVYKPDKSRNEPSDFDQEAFDIWTDIFRKAGLDPNVHIVFGGKKDNFWMMGDTGPCGPCSEIHVDLTPENRTPEIEQRGAALVNAGSPQCIEVWNHVFIQFNANPDGTFSPLPAKHVDTGMGFERVTSFIQCTKGFTDFSRVISNYETDIFRPIFDAIEKLSGKKYGSTLPGGAHAPSHTSGDRTRPRVLQSALSPIAPAVSGTTEAGYSRRNLPHFERPWAKYMVTFSTHQQRQLTPSERDVVLKSVLYAHEHRQYQLYAACVMPDHVHLLFEPQIKEQDQEGNPVFWSLSEILQGIKSASAHSINRGSGQQGAVWEKEAMDRMIRGQSDMEEKFHYICRNPWDAGIVPTTENYPWLWTPEVGFWSEGPPGDAPRPVPTARAQSAAREGACAPRETALLPQSEQEKIDVAFRVIADHIRTLSFAIADGIQPGNTDRNYVLRRILRRAVRYGRTLGFREPFFYKLVDVVADTIGHVFPEIREKKKHVQEVIQVEEEAFNKTLDKGIELFTEETGRLAGGTGYQPVPVGNLPTAPGARYSKRNLPHFEKPWAIYAIHFRTFGNRALSETARDIAFDCILHWREKRYRLIAACVMPDHVHLLLQPGIKEMAQDGTSVFWSLSEILHSIKSFSANEINKMEKVTSPLWQEERFDRYMRSDRDLQEKFDYICRNPWASGIVDQTQPYRWLWTQDIEAAQPYVAPATLPYAKTAGQVARQRGLVARSTEPSGSPWPNRVSGEFAFQLYDTYGFPLDLTELMARERGLTVDKEGFEKLMEEQRARARAAQKKEVIELSQLETTTPTKFIGYDSLETPAKVLEVVGVKNKTAVVLDTSTAYAEMGGQVGDTGELIHGGQLWRVVNTQKSGNTWLHFIEKGGADAPSRVAGRATAAGAVDEASTAAPEAGALPVPGDLVTLSVDRPRREAIQRHHTVTHLLHWALHEVVSPDATQKGSFVGPDKLTFDFNSAPLTPQQVADIEKLVNERILENAGVSWTEVPYADVKSRKDVLQFFGDKYGDTVRVVQIGGRAGELNGYSMELCGGTHTRATGEIGLFRIVGENAIQAGVRRIEAVAGLEAYRKASEELHLIKNLAGKVNSPVGELEKKIEALLARQKELERQIDAAQQREASSIAANLKSQAGTINGIPAIIYNLGSADGDLLQSVADALKGVFKGVIVLGGVSNGAVALVAAVTPEFTARVQAGKIIQQIAPLVGGKGGGRPDNARGGGKDPTQLAEALAKAKSLLG